jgi:hypothetical protein
VLLERVGEICRLGCLGLGCLGSADASQKVRGEASKASRVLSSPETLKDHNFCLRLKAQGLNGPMTVSKQLQVYQRKEASSSKPMKLWVVDWGEDFGNPFSGMPEGISTGIERCTWNNGRCVDFLLVGLLGKTPSVRMAIGEVTARASPAMGESEVTGILGAYVA